MLKQSQKLTKGLLIFSVRISDFEKLDFKNDALAGVRANYFNSKNSPQRDKTEIELDSRTYNLSYVLQGGSPLMWKATRDNLPYQSVKRGIGGIYSVIFYTEDGIIYKRQFFDSAHNWIRTEYYDRQVTDRLLCRAYPETISKITVLKIEKIAADGAITTSVLYPSAQKNGKKCSALIYSNMGMLWYDEKFKPQDMPESQSGAPACGGFMFTQEQFKESYKPVNTFDIQSCEYLETPPEIMEKRDSDDDEHTYSAYEKIENILSEAQKTNKDLFGEIVSQTADDSGCAEALPKPQAEAENQQISEVNTDDAYTVPDSIEAADKTFDIGGTAPCDAVIITKSGRYTYYGSLDENNCRTGRGRTVAPDGLTSYDGEYLNDLRSGFGVCYYKDGSINYVGDWSRNNRHGCGVGYRQSDGTMHIGKWINNTPDGCGARFTQDGELLDVCMYNNGLRSGKGVSFDENGKIVLSVYENGEKISETVIEDEIKNESD